MSSAPASNDARPAYRAFRVSVARTRRLSPHFTRITFTGDDLLDFGTAGLDQRVKVVLPLPEVGFEHFPQVADWYAAWRELPSERRNPFRTYTVRAVRPEQREVDIDFVGHGDAGPASRWAARAAAGDEVVIVGPDERSPGRALGIDWRPGHVSTHLLAGDETAAPAIASILATLPPDATGVALIEVPDAADALDLVAPEGVSVRFLPRTPDGDQGQRLIPALRDWVARTCSAAGRVPEPSRPTTFDDPDDAPLWDVPEGSSLDADCYAWIAGEAGMVKALRRFLVTDAGLDRRQVAFMGYWRTGRAELD
ncbi:hypothetical protein BW730_12645 [Tessaracoccus aquimaris]|uniref:FAD-binding FR-type domain-containing protein n=1 Tax=Tessaracoccus aquimaris TaxID=1332264 RepID=A0A1Q2CQ26_9ACTN|nr:siderophore-interacting protein [Tessaracoccus aquimaris]AQP48227.1 hypothetical protein BW730_12645 [Tessaracoccus aquimaris]